MRTLSVLGATGSIGVSTLDLISRAQSKGEDLKISVLTGGSNAVLLAEQALRFRPELTVIADEKQWKAFSELMAGSGLEIACGEDNVIAAAARPVDWVMAAIVGIAGLRPTWAAAGTGAILALANKESLVCCGRALIERVKAAGGTVIPVDSEHNAIFQVLEPARETVGRLILTASGGPFFGKTRDELMAVTREQALKHPNWSMGPKITIDSATLANKGLELIEAAYLFETTAIDVLIHPQSVIHSMVEYKDGSTLAQLGPPDMRVPISYALNWPQRLVWDAPGLDLKALANLSFFEPDEVTFPMLRLAREALEIGGIMPIVFNAANEASVAAFLAGRINFLSIAQTVENAMIWARSSGQSDDRLTFNAGADHIETVMAVDRRVRDYVHSNEALLRQSA
jgi:1-deoxy-D-xylulose-5-phosphate reductoisomerase